MELPLANRDPKLQAMIVDYPVRMGWEVISIQDGGGMLTSSIRHAYESRTSAKA